MKKTILEILSYKIQPEITKYEIFLCNIFMRFNFITQPCSQEENYQQNIQIKHVKFECPIKR